MFIPTNVIAPAAHASTHAEGGADELKLDDCANPDDNTDLNASISAHGLLPKLPSDAGLFLNGTGGWSSPVGSGSGGETNTASNFGTDGVGPFDSKSGVDLRFRNIAAASPKITVTLDNTDKDIDLDIATGTTADTVCVGNDSRLSDARTPTSHTHPQSEITDLVTDLAAKADLVAGKVPVSQIPAVALSNYLGEAVDEAAMLALTGSNGDYTLRTDQGVFYILIDDTDESDLASWLAIGTPTSGVISVNGHTGTVVLTKSDLGLSNVPNTDATARANHTGTQTRSTISDFAHQTTHGPGGSDALKLDDLAVPDDNTDLNASSLRHGLLRKLSGNATEYLDGSGAWSTPPGGGGAPTNAQYVVATADGTLSAERVATDTAVIAWDFTSPGQAKLGLVDDGVSNAKLRDSTGLSVIGRSAATSGDPADVVAASDHQVLRRSGSTIGFGAVALNQANAVTGALAIANGGTGQTAQTGAFNALSPITTKGDLISRDGTNNIRVAVGTNGYALVADSAATPGIKWAPIMEIGTTVIYLQGAAPTGWLLQDGSAVSRTTYAALFALYGTTYGSGDGSTTFNLPNSVSAFGVRTIVKALV